MNNYGFIRAASAIPFSKVGDINYNKLKILSLIEKASSNSASVIVFPELSITSYTCGDLFHHSSIINDSLTALLDIAKKTKNLPILSIIGAPVKNNNNLYNCAVVINKGKIIGIIPKSFIPSYREFYETRWFKGTECRYNNTLLINNEHIPFGDNLLFESKEYNDFKVGIEICEDLWMPIPPSSHQALNGATVLCNLSASNILTGKSEYRRELVKNQSSRCIAAYIYTSTGMGESTTDIVFDADAAIVENGVLLSESERFLRKDQVIYADIDIERLIKDRIKQFNTTKNNKDFLNIQFTSNCNTLNIKRYVPIHPFIPETEEKLDDRCREIINIQASGLAKRLESIPGVKSIIGVSGGLDSTLALLVIIKAYELLNRDKKEIIAVTMPGFGTSTKTYTNTVNLCKNLGVAFIEKDIKDISNLLISKIEHNEKEHDITYENIQARARTYLLMTLANKNNAIVIGTGDLSEIALGWSTYNGDHISMYNVNSGVPKTLIKFLVSWYAKNSSNKVIENILTEIIEQPISPELIPAKEDKIIQDTEEKIGPYELHDFFLYYFLRYGFDADKILMLAVSAFKDKYKKTTIKKWLNIFTKRFFNNQWKRDCVPAGPKIGSIDLSPRGTWRMPADSEDTGFTIS